MSRFTRILSTWILVALLPLHGYAAAAMISCGPMHAQQAGSAEAFHHSHASNAAGVSHTHHESAGTVAGGSGHDSPALPDLLKFKCSACAACCTGAAAPSPSMPSMAAIKSRAVTSLFFDWSDHSIVLPGLDRPPSAPLA
jgi:hypothetical protein